MLAPGVIQAYADSSRIGAAAISATGSTDFMHARYYSPNLGRFLSVDSVGGEVGSSQSWNRYSYVNNNPLNLIDPDGRLEVRAVYDRGVGIEQGRAKHPYIYEIEFDTKLQRVGNLFGRRLAKKLVPHSYLISGAEKADEVIKGGTVELRGEDTEVEAISGFSKGPEFEQAIKDRFEEIAGEGDGGYGGAYGEDKLDALQSAITDVVNSMEISESDKAKILMFYNANELAKKARQISNPPAQD